MKLYMSVRARRRANLLDIWWREHRPSAPNLFADELAHALELLLDSSRIGAVHKQTGTRVVRRYLLQKTQQHVFYWVDERRGRLTVVTVWGAARGRRPVIR